MSTVSFREVPSVPRMAWCARVAPGRDGTTVYHGSWVETGASIFAEGAWNGAFSEAGFADADVFLGSGAVNLDGHPTFSSASHPFEPLYSLSRDRGVFISNSLSFLGAATGTGPKFGYPYYVTDLISFTRGLSRCVSKVPMDSGESVRVHYCSNVDVGGDLEVREERRSPLPPVGSYTEYREFLSAITTQIDRNCRDTNRKQTFSPLATISSGYDSPATAVMAREIGASEAVTFRSARSTFGPEPDAGNEVAKHLGLEVIESERLQFRERDDFPEADFLATGTGGEDVVFASIEDRLDGTLLFTGFLGDTVWGKHHPDPRRSLDFAMTHPAGASLREYRLRVGFVHFPVPLTTFTQHPSLNRISQSDEMEPWTVAGSHGFSGEALLGRKGPGYDRPIARRIVEEEGVPRELFGQSKRAVSQPFYHDEDLEEIMSPRSLEDFRGFLKENGLPPQGLKATVHKVTSRAYSVLTIPFDVIRKLSLFFGWAVGLRLPWPDRFKGALNENVYTFHWAMEQVRARYEKALAEADARRD